MSSSSRKLRRAASRRAAILASRLSDCICNPDLVHIREGHIRVDHDLWCPMVDRGTQLVIQPLAEVRAVSGPYQQLAALYLERGFSPVPIHIDDKTPILKGNTGHGGVAATPELVSQWSRQCADANIGLRLGADMIGIDVDHYGDKRGADHLAAVEKELGELPPAPYSTSRGAGPSGIRLYRIPAGLEFPGKPCDDVEFIQRHHRTVVAAPSVHKSGRVYEWHSNDPRLLVHGLPTVDTVPDLPPHWVEYFRKDRPRDARQHVTGTTNNTVSKAVEAALGRWYLNAPGGRHDAMCAAVLALARLDDSEHPGAGDALARIRGDFIQRVTTEGPTRTPAGAEKEFDDAVESARALSERRPRRDRRTTS